MGSAAIVIPTLDRSKLLSRTLRYLASDPLRGRVSVVVLDGSKDPAHAEQNRVICSVTHATYRAFDPSIDVFERIAAGLRDLQTDYALIFADDNFVHLDAILRCAAFLDLNSDYTTCAGRYGMFRVKGQDKISIFVETWKDRASYEHDSPIERMFWALQELPHSLYYGLHRTKDVSDTFERIARAMRRPFDIQISDALFVALTAARGKIGNIQKPFMLIESGQSVERNNTPFGHELFLTGSTITERYGAAKRELMDLAGIDSETIDVLWGVYAAQSLSATMAAKRLIHAHPQIKGSLVTKARNRRGFVNGFNFAAKFMKEHFGVRKLTLRKIDRPVVWRTSWLFRLKDLITKIPLQDREQVRSGSREPC